MSVILFSNCGLALAFDQVLQSSFFLPRGPVTSTAVTGAYSACAFDTVWSRGRSRNCNDTSGGTAIGAAPIRDCLDAEIENGLENAGSRKDGSVAELGAALSRDDSLRSRVQQFLDVASAILTGSKYLFSLS